MKSAEIREKFLRFFESKGHRIVPSSSLVPHEDPTLLFTNAGMNQFKDVFLGFDKRPYTRATTAQKCVRAGGKHNDLENVGYTARHHTFFEMLGNFSFGDYFKRDALLYAWELLTRVYGLPPEKLWATVYAEDDEAYLIWRDTIGLPEGRIIRIGDNKGGRYASDNFWMMGDTGPCGPCSEIFYDHGEHIPGGPPGSPDEDGDRYIEIWNNVFMQFNRDENGIMHTLPRPSVDTGMGLERMAAVLQHVNSNYDTDLLGSLVNAAARETDSVDMASPSLRVLADHIRACSFLVADGVIPGNEGRGYVLRRIIRRAIRHGYKLGARAPFFHRLVPGLVAEMGDAYPELAAGQQGIAETLHQEERRFFATIDNGMAILENELAALKDGYAFNGETAFRLHDTFGFPLDLTADICRERGVRVDETAFEAAMNRQKERARAAGKFKMAAALEYNGPETAFLGYESLELQCKAIALYKEGSPVEELREGDSGTVVLDRTPFYAESGGQTGDRGMLRSPQAIFAVEDTQKIQAPVFGHQGVLKTGRLKIGEPVDARVDSASRCRAARNHSATHLMHKALREVLGDHVQQKGSQVDDSQTRFDFSHSRPMTDEEIRRVEARVNAEILENSACLYRVMPLAEARELGAMMLFGEKYAENVRVADIGSSRELCGGTHVLRTGDIGPFLIVSESGIAAGIRRIEALTGDNAIAHMQKTGDALNRIAGLLKAAPAGMPERVDALLAEARRVERELFTLKEKLALAQSAGLAGAAVEIRGAYVVAATVDGADIDVLRGTLDRLRDKLKTAVIVLASVADGKATVVAGITPGLTGRIKAGELVGFVAKQIGGKGGGRPDMAQAGGTDIEKLPGALALVNGWVEERL
ncbi:MAG: alanine--tRNA ligase [Candidatus Accumulibacter sp.]|nr:alanine--tRNA ligase [Accumulibacter sp.]